MPLYDPLYDPQGRVHSFCHAVAGKWHLTGVTLSAAGSLKWYFDEFGPTPKKYPGATLIQKDMTC